MSPVPPTADRQPTEYPIYWFTLLELAVERGNFAAAAEAQGRLQQLGVQVEYGRPAPRGEARRGR